MKKNNITFITLSALVTALLCISAYIRIPFPLVPISMQTFVVLFSGLYLGSKQTAVAIGVYILIGLLGLPVFSAGGGFAYVLKPSFGYLIGMIPAGYLAGRLTEQKNRSFSRNLWVSLLATLVIYLIGVPYYYLIAKYVLHMDTVISAILYSGFLILLPGDILKSVLASFAALKLPKPKY